MNISKREKHESYFQVIFKRIIGLFVYIDILHQFVLKGIIDNIRAE